LVDGMARRTRKRGEGGGAGDHGGRGR
jgi:hypothetical protein